MALTQEVQALVKQKKWQEAYDKASNDRQDDKQYFIVEVDNVDSDSIGYVLGDETNYQVTQDATEASYWEQKKANDVAKKIRTKKIKTRIVDRDAYVSATSINGTEKGEVIDLFLQERFKKFDIKPIKDMLVKQIDELGFSYNTNPFLQFIDIYLEMNGKIEEKVLTAVNDLYANDVLSTTDLQAKRFAKDDSIIFNSNLYKNKDEDIEFIVQAFIWLSDDSNLIEFMNNPEALTKYELASPKDIDPQKAKEIRNAVIFKNFSTVTKSEINSVADIQRETRFFQGVSKEVSQGKKTISIDTGVNDAKKWREVAQTSVKNAQEAQDLINFIAKEYKLV